MQNAPDSGIRQSWIGAVGPGHAARRSDHSIGMCTYERCVRVCVYVGVLIVLTRLL